MRQFLLFPCLLFYGIFLSAQSAVYPLWPEGIPCANELSMEIRDDARIGRIISKVHEPQLVAYLPQGTAATGTSVIICPGGGYTILAWDWEGSQIAEWFNSFGVAAFVLKYRLPHWESETCREQVALMDAQRALRLVRSKATEWQLHPNRIGIMGFSAGGHLASSVSTHFDAGQPSASNPVERYSSRPDFSILMYPVITMDTAFTHRGSRNNLIGERPKPDRSIYYSNEAQITSNTPPALLIHATDDEVVVPDNSIAYYRQLRKHGVSAALHIYEHGGHGFSFAKEMGSVRHWPTVCKSWLEAQGLLRPVLKALVIDGRSKQGPWKDGTSILQKQLLASGFFQVDIANVAAERASTASFQRDFTAYDLVVSNYNGKAWPTQMQNDFERYVANGGGFLYILSKEDAFLEWETYYRMLSKNGWRERTGKVGGAYAYLDADGNVLTDDDDNSSGNTSETYEFVVQNHQTKHPILKGLPGKWLHTEDKLYNSMQGPTAGMDVLATAHSDPKKGGTDRQYPVMMSMHYGLGRLFHTSLGHSKKALQCQGFQSIFQRAAEWVATGKVTQAVPKSFPSEAESMISQ